MEIAFQRISQVVISSPVTQANERVTPRVVEAIDGMGIPDARPPTGYEITIKIRK